MKHRPRPLFGLLVGVGILLHLPARAHQTTDIPQPSSATPDAPKPLTRPQRLTNELLANKIALNAKAQSLAEIVDTLATKLHCSILVDDDPLLANADVQCDGTGKDALDKVADVFDYTWEAAKSGGVLMRKRFRNPSEHPQMNYAELRQMAHDAVSILSILHFNPHSYQETWPFILRELYNSFTPEQRVIFTDETKSLTMPQLAPAQRSLVERAIYCSGYQDQIRAWNTFADQLDALPNSWMQQNSLQGFLAKAEDVPDGPVPAGIKVLILRLPVRGGRDSIVPLLSNAGRHTKEKKP